jgi:hypothetical protein
VPDFAEEGAQVGPAFAPGITACRVPRTDAAGLAGTISPVTGEPNK